MWFCRIVVIGQQPVSTLDTFDFTFSSVFLTSDKNDKVSLRVKRLQDLRCVTNPAVAIYTGVDAEGLVHCGILY